VRHSAYPAPASTSRTRRIHGHGLFFGAYGSVSERSAPAGSVAMLVSERPSGMLILVNVFTAQPLASRMGPRLRSRSLSQAMITAGPEITRISPRMPSGIHLPSPKNFSSTAPKIAVTPLIATLIAASTPMSIFFGSGLAGPACSVSPVVVAVVWSFVCASASAAAARFATCSSIQRRIFLYGAQNACPTLIGLSMILAIVAFQSRPLRS
jgi:hypothetical protein